MPRPRYKITTEDVPIVHRWIRSRFRDNRWPRDWPRLTAWEKFPLEKPTAKKLQPWCDRFLDARQWQQLHAVIRAARREKHASRTVRLNQKAYDLLHTLAEREQLTLSTTIERFLSDRMNPPSIAAIPGTMALLVSPPSQDVCAPLWGARVDRPHAKFMKVKLYLRVEKQQALEHPGCSRLSRP